MKYELQTIPVWKAVEAAPECLLCHLEAESESRNVEFFLGSSIMAPEMRVQLNERGFCQRHLHLLACGTGKLGLSLALGTHLDSLRSRLVSQLRGPAKRALDRAVAWLSRQERECLMCDRVAYNLLNYAYTVVTLFRDEPQFRDALEATGGFCLRHLSLVLRMGPEVLRDRDMGPWRDLVLRIEERELGLARDRLEQFSWQFDYQTERSTPAEAQDAVPRAVRRIVGIP